MNKPNFFRIVGMHPSLWFGWTVNQNTLRELQKKNALKDVRVRPVKKKPKPPRAK